MPGAMRKLGLYLGLVEDDEHGRYETGRHGDHDAAYDPAYDDGYGEGGADWAPEPSPVRRLDVRGGSGSGGGPVSHGSLAVDLRPRPLAVEEDLPSYRITTLHPTTYNEARTIGEHFRDGTPVIMNLTSMDDVDAKRLVDFAAGLIFGLRGSIERVTNKVFLLSPQNVEVTAEDKALIVEGGFFNQS